MPGFLAANQDLAPDTTVAPASAKGSYAAILFSAGLLLCLFGAIFGEVHLWEESGFLLWGASRYPCILGFVTLLVGLGIHLVQHRTKPTPLSGLLHPATFAVGLLFLFLTDWCTRAYSFFPGPTIRGELILAFLAGVWISKRKLWTPTILFFSILTPVFVVSAFFIFADGRLIFSDDHPVFLFRLISLTHAFPWIPFFNPLWNGGIDARDFFATGTLNVFLPLLPFFYLFDPALIYNGVVALVVFILPLFSVYFAARLSKFSARSCAISVILAACLSLVWYRWGLKYGTMGFLTSASLVPLNLALITRLLTPESTIRWPFVILSVVTITLMLFWSLAGAVFIPLLVLAGLRSYSLLKKPALRLFLVLMLAINVPWVMLFLSVSKVGNFLTSEKPSYALMHENGSLTQAPATAFTSAAPKKDFRHKARDFSAERSVQILREQLISLNPLIFCLTIPGFFLLGRRQRMYYLLTVSWLLVLGAGVAQVKPQLELDRMLLIAALLSVLPTALAIDAILTASKNSVATAVTGGTLLLSPWISASIVLNRSLEHYFFATPVVDQLAQAISQFGGSGRTLFSGFVLHELEHGHLAPLVYTAKKPLMASSYAHDQWRYKHVVPLEFLNAGPAGQERFFELYNVTAVAAHEPKEVAYFRHQPANYTEVWHGGKFVLFRRIGSPSQNYFFSGEGQILAQEPTFVRLMLNSPKAVIKFNYFPFLQANGCTLTPFPVSDEATFIELTGCPTDTPIEISARAPWHRYPDLWRRRT